MKHLKLYEESEDLSDFTKDLFGLTSIWHVRGKIEDWKVSDLDELDIAVRKCVELFSSQTGEKIEFIRKISINGKCDEFRFKIYARVDNFWLLDNLPVIPVIIPEIQVREYNRSGYEVKPREILYRSYISEKENETDNLPEDNIEFRSREGIVSGFYRIKVIIE